MHYLLVLLVTILVTLSDVFAKGKLPSYIHPCKIHDPSFAECAKREAKHAIPYILKGDKKFRSPSLQPLHLPLIEIEASRELRIVLKNVVLSGLELMDLKDFKTDLDNRYFEVLVFSPRLNLEAEYQMDGNILVLPIQGKGPANLTFVDASIVYSFNHDLVEKGGKQYITNIRPKVHYTIGRSYYHFENLFNGNKELGEQTNKFLNENYEEVSKDLGQSVSETISAVVTNILNLFLTQVPYDEIFLP